MKQFKSENYRLSSILVNHMKVKSSVNSTEKNCFIASLCIYICDSSRSVSIDSFFLLYSKQFIKRKGDIDNRCTYMCTFIKWTHSASDTAHLDRWLYSIRILDIQGRMRLDVLFFSKFSTHRRINLKRNVNLPQFETFNDLFYA